MGGRAVVSSVLAAIVVTLVLTASPSGFSQDRADALARADAAFHDGRYAEAATAYREAVAANPASGMRRAVSGLSSLSGFWADELTRFFHAIARELLSRGWLRLSFLEINGERSASAFAFDYANQILVYNSGYDPHRFAEYSPGVILFGSSIRAAILAGRDKFDFLRGNESYKYHFGAHEQQLYKIVVTRK